MPCIVMNSKVERIAIPILILNKKTNQSNPHWTKVDDANEKYLGLSGGRDNQTSFAREWNNDYVLDLIGREYCRDRSIACKERRVPILMSWQQAKGHVNYWPRKMD